MENNNDNDDNYPKTLDEYRLYLASGKGWGVIAAMMITMVMMLAFCSFFVYSYIREKNYSRLLYIILFIDTHYCMILIFIIAYCYFWYNIFYALSSLHDNSCSTGSQETFSPYMLSDLATYQPRYYTYQTFSQVAWYSMAMVLWKLFLFSFQVL